MRSRPNPELPSTWWLGGQILAYAFKLAPFCAEPGNALSRSNHRLPHASELGVFCGKRYLGGLTQVRAQALRSPQVCGFAGVSVDFALFAAFPMGDPAWASRRFE
jgi:hypothetical protein